MRYKIMAVYYDVVIGFGMLIEAALDAVAGE